MQLLKKFRYIAFYILEYTKDMDSYLEYGKRLVEKNLYES